MIDVAITIVNFKMTEDIRQLLETLQKDLTGSSLKVQVVIVDNTPGPEIQELLKKYPEVKYLPQEKNRGFGAAQNVALKYVGAKYYFVLNPDTVFFEGERAIEKLYEFMERRSEIGMIGPKLLNSDGSLQYSCYRFPNFWIPLFRRSSIGQKDPYKKQVEAYSMKDFDHNKTQAVDWIMGSAMFIRGSVLKEVGYFDERFFMYFEDCDLCRRFWEAHAPVYYVHDIKLTHHHGRGSAKVSGFFRSILQNHLTRIHIVSWLKYMWKWRGLTI